MQLTAEQERAVKAICTEPVAVVTGGPGTGKTTVLRIATAHLRSANIPYVLVAPTGKAARRITEVTSEEAYTIHRALMIFPVMPLTVIVDEASMVDVSLLATLIRHLTPNHRLVLIGDADQLPPIRPGHAFADIINSGVVPTVRLTAVHRAAAHSWVCLNAPEILGGRIDLTPHADFAFIKASTELDTVNAVRLIARSEAANGHSFQLLSPMNKGGLGVDALNRVLQTDRVDRDGVTSFFEMGTAEKSQRLYIGDPVAQTENDYGRGVFNGEIGIVHKVQGDHAVDIDFHGTPQQYTMADALKYLRLAYTLTVHRSQGSEYHSVGVICHDAHLRMWTRQLLYTAVTRAKGNVYIVGSEATVRHALRTDAPSTAISTLAGRLQ